MTAKLFNAVITSTAKAFEVKAADIKSESRSTAQAALARQVAMFVFLHKSRSYQVETAKAFGRDPSTVTFARKKIEKMMKRDPKMRTIVNKLCA